MRPLALPLLATLLLAAPALAQPVPGSPAADLDALIAAADRNRDGRIDRAEMEAALARSEASDGGAFERDWAERNTIPGVLPTDAGAALELARSGLRMLREADANGDGIVTREEANAYIERLPPQRRQAAAYGLALGDTDFDGVASREEIEALRRRAPDEAASLPPPETDEARRAKADARRDFLEARARDREQVRETWRTLSDANNAVPTPDLRREVLSSGLR